MRKHLGFIAVLLLSLSFLVQLPQVRGTDRYVPDVYPTIQAAVTAADPGDTIMVAPGVYRESVTVGTSVFIVGQDESTTIVDGSGGGYAFWLSVDDVTIRGFTLRDCMDYGVMAYYSGGHTIEDNIFLNNAYGVYLSNSPSASSVTNNTLLGNGLIGIKVAFSTGDLISHNYISGGQYGIKIDDQSQSTTVASNTIVGTSHGIYVRYSPNNNVEQNEITSIITGIASVSSDYTNIQDNTVYDCAHGIELFGSTYNTVFANTAAQNGYGLYLAYANDNTISSNLASNNDWGIRLYESDSSTITENTFSFNGYGVELISYSTGNTIAWNDILNSTLQMHQDSTSGGNTWDKKSGGTTYGNFWSDYVGEDTDGDGVGDTRLPHTGVDYYPLINPWSTVHDVAVVSVVASDTEVSQGELVNITVIVRNEGTTTETFDVTAKYFNLPIETKTVTNLPRLETTTIIFSWDTASVPMGFDCEISAEAETIIGETDIADNTYVDGTVTIKGSTVSIYPPIIIGPPPNIAETFVVNVTASDVFNLWSWQVGMTFNPDVLEAAGFAEGPFLATGGTTLWEPGTINNTLGIIEPHRCTLTSGSAPVSGSGTLAFVTFRVKDYGSSSLHLGPDPSEENVILFDPAWTQMSITLKDGYFKLARPPTASFTFSPSTPYTDETVTFNASASYDLDGYIVSYFWDFGDGTNRTGEVATHSFADDGTYTVAVTVTDNDGLTDTTSTDVTVLNRPPVAIFTESAETVLSGELIYFNASDSYDPDGYIASYFWDFGDGTNATGAIVNHAYADDGFYTVTLTVTDNDGAIASTTAVKTVNNRPPIAIFTESAETVNTGVVIYFNASASYDPDGYIIEYFWDFGDGTNATGVTVQHAYADDGTYTVTLTVTDDDGATAFTTSLKTVLNRPPVASFTASATTVPTGEVITFNASASYDPDGYIVSYRWDFGDGNVTTLVDPIITHAYDDNGTYTVTLTVTDDDGATASTSSTKTVLNRPPVSIFTESAEVVDTGVLITFNASDSYDPDGYIASYFWDFGDGTNATGVIVSHAYDDNGTYTVTLTVTDNDGAIASTTAVKTVNNRLPTAVFTESATTVLTGEVIYFNASGSYDPDGYVVGYFWDFGDGEDASGVVVNHAYADDGTYTVTLTVTDDDGATAFTTSLKTVLNRPPVASFSESAETVYTGEVITFNASASYDPDGAIVAYFWDFGDGTNATGIIVDHAYADNGTYTVTLTVTDDDGASDLASATKTVLNRPPVADFTYSPSNPFANEPVTFDASTSYDPDGVIFSYFWDFGDGTNGTGVVVDHAYIDDGTYIVTLTVTDDDGATGTTTASVTVSYYVRDVAIVGVVLSATEAYPTWIVPLNITVTVENQGERTETFTVTVYYDMTAIGTQTVTLAQGANTTLVFSWNLSGVAEGTYTIRAEASVLFGETDVADNSLIDGTVELKRPGDANDDGLVNAYDLNILAKALGTSVEDPDYDRRADFNGDGVIDDYDVEILQLYWGP